MKRLSVGILALKILKCKIVFTDSEWSTGFVLYLIFAEMFVLKHSGSANTGVSHNAGIESA